MRSRNIKPGIYKNEALAECSIAARWLFPGLWCLADWQGRLENRPKRIKMEIFPGDSVDAEPLLDELEQHGLIARYGAEPGAVQPYIWIPNFRKHQSPHQNERKDASKFPAHPDDTEAETEALPEHSESAPVVEASPPQSNQAESGIPKPETGKLNADPRNRNPEAGRPTPKSGPTQVSGSAVSAFSDSAGSGSVDPRAYRQALWKRLKAVVLRGACDTDDGRDPPHCVEWWQAVAKMVGDAPGGFVVLEEAVKYVEDCRNPAVQAAKGLGDLTHPARFVASRCRDFLKPLGLKLPAPVKG